MDILEKHTAAYFGELRTIKRSGKTIYTARPAANSWLGLWHDGQRVRRVLLRLMNCRTGGKSV
nr:MAG TPA: hypothetical protein [Bacteriophage sp.]